MKRNYYFFRQGRLSRKNNAVCFEPTDSNIEFAQDENKFEEAILSNQKPDNEFLSKQAKFIPPCDIESIYILADVIFNSKFIEFASINHIPIHIFNFYGNYKGSFFPQQEVFGGTFIIRQCSFYLKPTRRTEIAKLIMSAAAHNIVKNIAIYKPEYPEVISIIDKIKQYDIKIGKALDVPEIMGYEANMRKEYYSTFNTIINSEVKFTTRQYNPPTDPMNALISFSNALVYSTVLGEIFRTKLNPCISFLHEPSDKRYSLSFDLAEIYKPLLADRMIFKLLNKGMITQDDFHYTDDNACYLNPDGRKKVVEDYEQRINKIVYHRKRDMDVSYRRLIRLDCYSLINHINKEEMFQPFRIWW
jgi:CRISP-associated protein Cas1